MWPWRTGERAFPALAFPCPISYAQTGSGIMPYPVRSGQAAFKQVGFLPPGTFLIVKRAAHNRLQLLITAFGSEGRRMLHDIQQYVVEIPDHLGRRAGSPVGRH